MTLQNTFLRLKALLPAPPVLVATVVSHNADGTSTLQVDSGAASSAVAPGLSQGATLRARGTGVSVGQRAFVRDGLVESQAPEGPIVQATIGAVSAVPFGPGELAQAGALLVPAAVRNAAYALETAPAWSGGWAPRAYALTTGTLPTGLSLDATTGRIAGTPTVAGTASGLVVTCTDSTARAVLCSPFTIVIP